MVGNDVVDLGDYEALADTRHPRFDERVFAASERRWLDATDAGNLRRWAFWAAKESAYKIARRRDARVVFSPRRFVVELDSQRRGRVRHGADVYPVRVGIRAACLHAVATLPAARPAAVWSGASRLPRGRGREPGREARALAVAAVAARLALDPDSLEVVRNGRIPSLRRREDGREVAQLSLSHHGRFVAYACALSGRGAGAVT
jgi:hypothetical protein